jgi:hypothetical protein
MDQRRKSGNVGGQPAESPSAPRVLIRPRPVAATVPVDRAEPLTVLARMPNLESEPAAGRRSSRSHRQHREQGRLLSSRLAVPLLVGTGLLLVAGAVVPLLTGKKEAVSAKDEQSPPAWRSDGSDPWTSSSPGCTADSTNPVALTASQEKPQNDRGSLAGPIAPSVISAFDSPAPAAPQTVQVKASHWEDPAGAGAAQPAADISSWRDAGRWPYGNGVGQPELSSSNAYPGAGEQPASYSYELPAGVQGMPIPGAGPYAASDPAPACFDCPQQPEVGMNRSMALGQEIPAQGGEYSAASWQTQQAPAGGSWGSSVPGGYSGDARYAAQPETMTAYPAVPSSGSAGAYPNGAAASGYSGDVYPAAQTPIGTPIPGTADAGAYGSGAIAYPGPQGPGAARFQGVIEKPSVRTSYDYNRSSIR